MTLHTLKTPLLLLTTILAACHSDDMPGGADMGAASDGPPAGGTIVAIRGDKGAPVAGADILVSDQAGAVVQTYKTGADGQVQVMVPPGGIVSALQQEGDNRYIDAVAAPPAGVRLNFPAHTTPAVGPLPTQLSLTLAKVPTGAKQLRFHTGCRSGLLAATETTLKSEACEVNGKYDIVAIALDDGGKWLGWGALLAQEPKPGVTVTGTLSLDRTDFAAVDVELKVMAGRRALARLLPQGALSARLPGLSDRVSAQSPPMGQLKGHLMLPALVTDGFRIIVTAMRDVPESAKNTFSSSVGRTRTFQMLPPTVSETLEAVPEVTFADPDLTDPVRPSYTWQLSAAFPGDAGVLFTQYDTDQSSLFYSLLFPVDRATMYRLPQLPEGLSAWAVDKMAQHSYGEVSYYDYEGVSGYAEYLDQSKLDANSGVLYNLASFTLKP